MTFVHLCKVMALQGPHVDNAEMITDFNPSDRKSLSPMNPFIAQTLNQAYVTSLTKSLQIMAFKIMLSLKCLYVSPQEVQARLFLFIFAEFLTCKLENNCKVFLS